VEKQISIPKGGPRAQAWGYLLSSCISTYFSVKDFFAFSKKNPLGSVLFY